MIERFTDEELEIIKRELIQKEYLNPHTKAELNRYISAKLNGIFGDQFYRDDIRTYPGVEGLIIKACDMCFKNYENSYSNGKTKKKASVYIPYDYCEEYMQMVNEILDAVEKHNKGWKE